MDSKTKKQIRHEQIARGLQDPSAAFCAQRAHAKRRGIEWQLTFEEWWGIWKDYYHLRGSGRNGLVMGREGDTGPYAVGNVYLTTNLGNLLDYHGSEKAAKERRERSVRRYEAKPPERWGKVFCGSSASGLTKAKNFYNGVETILPQEDA